MKDKINVEMANPLIGLESVILSISDIQTLHTNIESRINNGLVVSVPDDDTTLLLGVGTQEIDSMAEGDKLDIYYVENNAYKYNGEFKMFQDILSKAQTGEKLKAKVTKIMDRGVLVTINGLQCFMPGGQIDLQKSDSFPSLINNTIEVKIIKIKLKEKEGNRFLPIVSHKVIEEEKNFIGIHEKLKDIKVDSIIQGTVKSIVNYGVFVTLYPSIDGLIHITDLSWERVTDPSEILSVGEKINVVILEKKIMKNGKIQISLGLKQLLEKPWERFDKNTKIGDIVSGSICNITDYGLFIMLPSGVQGLVHKTELSWNPKFMPKDFQLEELVNAKIINIDWEKEKLLLSIKQIMDNPWEKYTVGQHVKVKILENRKNGIMVKLENDDLLSFIPKKLIPQDCVIEGNGNLECLIQDINEKKGKVILTII